MLVLDFINVGNGDSILVREMEGERLRFSMLVDCGHDALQRDDHPELGDPNSRRIYAGDFLRKNGVTHLDILLRRKSPAPAGSLPGISCEVKVWRIWISCW